MPPGFAAQTLLAFCAMFCLPRQFQIGVVECEDPRDLRRARWLFPIYMVVISLGVLAHRQRRPRLAPGHPGTCRRLGTQPAIALGDNGIALLAFVGGFSAATGMVIVAAVALATMISNDLVMPMLLRIERLGLERRGDLSNVVLSVRRIAIVGLAGMAYFYYRLIADAENLAATGLLSFAAVAQFAPAIVSALYWRGASRVGVYIGLLAGFAVWGYTLLLPAMTRTGWIASRWLDDGPFGIGWLRPTELFHLSGWEPVTHGTFWSLLTNVSCLVFISLRFRPSVAERLHAALFVDPFVRSATGAGDWRGRVTVRDLGTIAGRIVGERVTARAFNEYGQRHGVTLAPSDAADRPLIQFTERLLASAVGAASARRILMGALSGHRPGYRRGDGVDGRGLAGAALQPGAAIDDARERVAGHQRRRRRHAPGSLE